MKQPQNDSAKRLQAQRDEAAARRVAEKIRLWNLTGWPQPVAGIPHLQEKAMNEKKPKIVSVTDRNGDILLGQTERRGKNPPGPYTRADRRPMATQITEQDIELSCRSPHPRLRDSVERALLWIIVFLLVFIAVMILAEIVS